MKALFALTANLAWRVKFVDEETHGNKHDEITTPFMVFSVTYYLELLFVITFNFL